MILISIYRNSNKAIERFVIEGHAHMADPGKDIVCAAVSALGQTTVLSLRQIANIDIEYEIKKGYLGCKLPKKLTGKELYESELLIDTMLLGLKNIQEGYPKHVKIRDKEV
ncbi:MAG: ribosomal-processing cysteine protease Prp [Candidatus Alkaliphilus sp. MAG34]|nr:ribosomal-processing cysteine protease Prp [Clostridiales bacterium]